MIAVISDSNSELADFATKSMSEVERLGSKACAVLYYDTDGGIFTHYLNCTTIDLQHFANALNNEAILKLVGENHKRVEQVADECDFESESN